MRYAVVIPTIGRACLADCLAALDRAHGPRPEEIVVVDDRPGDGPPIDAPGLVVRSGGRGPAAARNTGWRETTAPWVVFLDDDVRVTGTWCDDLRRDLEGDTRGEVGLDDAGDDVHRRPLRRDDQVDAGGTCELGEPRDAGLDLGRRDHHQVGELVDDCDDVG